MKTVEPLLKFRIYPDAGRLYFLVSIFADKRDMYSFCKKTCETWNEGWDYEAVCHTYTKLRIGGPSKRTLVSSQIGHMHFYQKKITMEVVTHEAVHAALAFYRRRYRKKSLNVMAWEEKLCYAAGIIGKEIVAAAEDLIEEERKKR